MFNAKYEYKTIGKAKLIYQPSFPFITTNKRLRRIKLIAKLIKPLYFFILEKILYFAINNGTKIIDRPSKTDKVAIKNQLPLV